MKKPRGPAGYIFGCTPQTLDECLDRRLFGLPRVHRRDVELIGQGTPLYLFVYTTRELYGGFEAASRGKLDIVPEAFSGRFPCQVPIRQVPTQNKTLHEDVFKSALKDNYYRRNKFKFWLDDRQVEELDSLFKANNSPPLSRPKREVRSDSPRTPDRKRRRDEHYMDDRTKHQSPYTSSTPPKTPTKKRNSIFNASPVNSFAHEVHHGDLFDPKTCCTAIDMHDLASGKDSRKTLCVGPLPDESDMDAQGIVDVLNETHKGQYDFLYVRQCGRARLCFLNVSDNGNAFNLVDRLHCRKWGEVCRKRVKSRTQQIKVGFWMLQGIDELAKEFRSDGYWHPGGPSSCTELDDDRPFFFYGAGAKAAGRDLAVQNGCGDNEAEYDPMEWFLKGETSKSSGKEVKQESDRSSRPATTSVPQYFRWQERDADSNSP